MNYKLLFTIIFLISLSLVGCEKNNFTNLSLNATVSKEHLEELGYKVISYEDMVGSYTLTEELINDMPYSVYWRLPGNDPNPYLGKTVEVEKFIVKNHPLDHWRHSFWIASNGKTNVFVYVVDGKVVGGTSYPVLSKWEDSLSGGYWSLTGEKTKE